jgi:hypothetical protein
MIDKLRDFRGRGGSLLYLIQRRVFRRKLPRQILYETRNKYWNHSARRVNTLMRGADFSYLEVGVADGTTLQAIASRRKVGVDPQPLFDITNLPSNLEFFKSTSDSYFRQLSPEVKFDFIFLDGLHEATQLLRDFQNSLRHLSKKGWILIDDVIPSDSISAIPDIQESYARRGVLASEGYPWHGDCFKILPILSKLEFIERYLIIYPDNPQILVRVQDWKACDHFLKQSEAKLFFEIERFDFQSVFSGEQFRELPLYLEELLFNELTSSGQ